MAYTNFYGNNSDTFDENPFGGWDVVDESKSFTCEVDDGQTIKSVPSPESTKKSTKAGKPTAKMLKALNSIQINLKIKFKGDKNSFDDVHDFLSEHLDKLKNTDILATRAPSEKQLKAISWIETLVPEQFSGNTSRDASDYISKYIDQAREFSQNKGNNKRK